MITRSNKNMEAYLRKLNDESGSSTYELPEETLSTIKSGFLQKDNTILLAAVNRDKQLPKFGNDQERMDYEYTNNKFSTDTPEEDEETNYLKRTLECAYQLADLLKTEFPGKKFKILAFFNETQFESEDHMAMFAGSSLRFYEVKEEDGDNDLEGYEGEAVLELLVS